MKNKIFIGIFYETVVVTQVATRADATKVLRKALATRHRKEAAAPISLMNHVALVYWSLTHKSFWYRLPSSSEPCAIHADRIVEKLHAIVPIREPDKSGWDAKTSAASPSR